MISLARHGDAILALQEETARIGQQVAALSSQFATAFHDSAATAANLAQLGTTVAELTALLGAQASIIKQQADQIVSLRKEAERRDQRASELRADLARIERQAALDLDEMRATSATITQALLAVRERRLGSSKE